MGYYTNYDIVALDDPSNVFDAFLKELALKSGYEEIKDGYGCCIKWYNWQEDALDLSLKYPDLLFMIEGDGEESCDNWRFYCKNGKSHITEPEWPEFNIEDLC